MSQEYDQLRDHEFDGIREYDNPLPRWWTWTFWGTFWFSLIYIGYYHSRDDRGVIAEYEAEMQAWYEKQTQELLAMGEVDEVMLATIMKNNAAVEQGEKVFQSTCKTCHKADGSGDIGPNLTDAHWLGGNTLMDIYTIVKDGRNKMPAWGKKLPPADVLKVAAYVGTLRGKNLDGKAPEGKKLAPAPVPDTRAAAKDSDEPDGDDEDADADGEPEATGE